MQRLIYSVEFVFLHWKKRKICESVFFFQHIGVRLSEQIFKYNTTAMCQLSSDVHSKNVKQVGNTLKTSEQFPAK